MHVHDISGGIVALHLVPEDCLLLADAVGRLTDQDQHPDLYLALHSLFTAAAVAGTAQQHMTGESTHETTLSAVVDGDKHGTAPLHLVRLARLVEDRHTLLVADDTHAPQFVPGDVAIYDPERLPRTGEYAAVRWHGRDGDRLVVAWLEKRAQPYAWSMRAAGGWAMVPDRHIAGTVIGITRPAPKAPPPPAEQAAD